MIPVIKFRGKSSCDNNWIFGQLINSGGKFYILPFESNSLDEKVEVLPDTVSQFTGVHDRKGKEVYELDIVETINFLSEDLSVKKRGYVSYLFQQAGFVIVFPNHDRPLGSRYVPQSQLKVIGNFVDNQELLKKEK